MAPKNPVSASAPLDRATVDDVVVRLLAHVLQRTEEDIRADRSRYAAFHEDDSRYDMEAGWLDWQTLTEVEGSDDDEEEDDEEEEEEDDDEDEDEDEDEEDDEDDGDPGNDNLYGRIDFDFARSLFDHEQFLPGTCTDKSLRRLFARQRGSLYGAQIQTLVAQQRLDPETLMEFTLEGRIRAEGDSLVDAARALFKLDTFGAEPPLSPGPYSKVAKKWKAILAELTPSPALRDHLGIFFQTAEAARCSGAALDGDPGRTLLELDGTSCYAVVAEWGVGEGQGTFVLARIVDDAIPPVPAFEGRVLIRKKPAAAAAVAAPGAAPRSLSERLAAVDALELGIDGDDLDTVADLRKRIEREGVAAFMKPLGASKGKLNSRCITIVQGSHLLLEAKAFDAALALLEAAAPAAGAPLAAAVHYNRGVALMKLERHAEACAAYQQALAASSTSALPIPPSHLHNNLAWTALQSGQLALAQTHAPLAVQADADNLLAVGTAGSVLFAAGYIDDAMKHFATCMAGGSDPEPGPEVSAHRDYRALALRYGIPVELTDEEAAALGPDGFVDQDSDDSDDEDDDESDDEDGEDDGDDEDDDEDEDEDDEDEDDDDDDDDDEDDEDVDETKRGPSVLALISKAEFEKLGATPGQPLDLSCYRSQHANLAPLSDGGDLYLVTVRPQDELWLVAVLRSPRLTKQGWEAAPNTQPFVSAASIATQLKFSTGKGASTEPGKLGMSLQTPRQLTAGDVALFEGLSGGAKRPASAAPAKADNGAPTATPYPFLASLDALPKAKRAEALKAYLASRGLPAHFGEREIQLEHAFSAMLGRPVAAAQGLYVGILEASMDVVGDLSILVDDKRRRIPALQRYEPCIQVFDLDAAQEIVAEAVDEARLKERAGQPAGDTIGVWHDDTLIGRVTRKELEKIADDLHDHVSEVRLTAPSDGTLFDALRFMLQQEDESWGMSDILDVSDMIVDQVDGKLEAALESVEDEDLRAELSAFCDEDGRSARAWRWKGKDRKRPGGPTLRFVAGVYDGEGVGFEFNVFRVDEP